MPHPLLITASLEQREAEHTRKTASDVRCCFPVSQFSGQSSKLSRHVIYALLNFIVQSCLHADIYPSVPLFKRTHQPQCTGQAPLAHHTRQDSTHPTTSGEKKATPTPNHPKWAGSTAKNKLQQSHLWNPLPLMDIKVVLRPQGELNLAKIIPAKLADHFFLVPQVHGFETDQIQSKPTPTSSWRAHRQSKEPQYAKPFANLPKGSRACRTKPYSPTRHDCSWPPVSSAAGRQRTNTIGRSQGGTTLARATPHPPHQDA